MADRQTTGGYPKLATVISADISLAGQLGPGDRLSFVLCSPKDAMAALIAQERMLMSLEKPAARKSSGEGGSGA
jgi:antagonist of KipI